MRQPLTIAVAQPECTPYDIDANASAHATSIRDAHARVVVFPEMSLTGYHLDAPAVEPDDPRLAPIVEACADRGAIALFGAPTSGADRNEHIAMLAADAGGIRIAYRKMFLDVSEAKRFAAGEQPVVFEVDGWRLGLAICKDTGTPEQVVATVALSIDAYVAGVVDTDADSQKMIERAARIARENEVWVAVASCAGSTGGGYDLTAGRSRICAPDGRVLAQAGPEPGEFVRHDFN